MKQDLSDEQITGIARNLVENGQEEYTKVGDYNYYSYRLGNQAVQLVPSNEIILCITAVDGGWYDVTDPEVRNALTQLAIKTHA